MRDSSYAILAIILGLTFITIGELSHAQKMRDVCAGDVKYEFQRTSCPVDYRE